MVQFRIVNWGSERGSLMGLGEVEAEPDAIIEFGRLRRYLELDGLMEMKMRGKIEGLKRFSILRSDDWGGNGLSLCSAVSERHLYMVGEIGGAQDRIYEF